MNKAESENIRNLRGFYAAEHKAVNVHFNLPSIGT